jgi:hypothetical protein
LEERVASLEEEFVNAEAPVSGKGFVDEKGQTDAEAPRATNRSLEEALR